jgi:hypothetical protein
VRYVIKFTILMLAVVGVGGCTAKPTEQAAKPGPEEHAHAEVGPHGGHLVELGTEEYHAEILHDGEAVIYLLDGNAQKTVAIDAPDVVVNVSHDGESEQFHLAASPEAGEPAGKASRFISKDAELISDLQEGHADVQLVVTVNGMQVRGTLEHDHEHGGEGHDH